MCYNLAIIAFRIINYVFMRIAMYALAIRLVRADRWSISIPLSE